MVTRHVSAAVVVISSDRLLREYKITMDRYESFYLGASNWYL